MSVEHDQIVRFKLNDGSVIDVDPILAEISGTIIDYLKTASGVEHEIPIQFEKITPETVEFMNKCIRWMKEKIPNELRGNSNEPNHWPDTFVSLRTIDCLIVWFIGFNVLGRSKKRYSEAIRQGHFRPHSYSRRKSG